MAEALKEARTAAEEDEVPVGAVVVRGGEIIARGRNRREAEHDPTAHAEIVCLRKAAEILGSWRLDECSLYVTLEPCPMCAGAIVNSRVGRVAYGAPDPKAGAMGSLYDLAEGRLNHRPEVVRGVMEEECGEVLRAYFRRRRKRRTT